MNYSSPSPSSVLLCDCLIPFLSPLTARSLCLGSARARSSNSICQPALGSRSFTAGRREDSRHYTASQPRHFIAPLKVMSFPRAWQTRRKLQRCQFSHKLPDLPRHWKQKGNFSHGYSWALLRVQYSGHSASAELCVEPLPCFLLARSLCQASLLN